MLVCAYLYLHGFTRTKRKFNTILKERINQNAFQYLTEKQRKKGDNITYVRIEMAEYLLPKLKDKDKIKVYNRFQENYVKKRSS